jgi:hypothetical protein
MTTSDVQPTCRKQVGHVAHQSSARALGIDELRFEGPEAAKDLGVRCLFVQRELQYLEAPDVDP